MLESDRLENFVASETGARRRSLGFETIWSTNSSRDQRPIALDPSSAAQINSPARPPATPLTQPNFGENFQTGSSSMMRSNSGFNVSGQSRYPNHAGLGFGELLPSYGNNLNTSGQRVPENISFQAQPPQNMAPNSFWPNGGNEGAYQGSINSPNMYGQSPMNFPSTPNIASQNVSPNFQQVVSGQPFLKYESLGQGLNKNINTSPFIPQYQEPQYGTCQPSSNFSSPQVLQIESRVGNQDQVELSSLQNLHINEPSSQKSVPYRNENSSHLRRHSYGEYLLPKKIETPVPSDDSAEIYSKELNDYFALDPHQRVKIDYSTICSFYERDYELLAPQYQLPDFKSKDSLSRNRLVLVAFKSGRLDIFMIPSQNTSLNSLQIGSLVIVDADRGFDLGRIVRTTISPEKARVFKMLMFLEHQSAFTEKTVDELQLSSLLPLSSKFGTGNSSKLSELNDPKNVLAFAEKDEIGIFLKKKSEEEDACRLTIETMMEILNPSKRMDSSKESPPVKYEDLRQLTIIDAEYQFDRKKLTFYFSSPRRLDFRDFLNVLFKTFKARIWMEAVSGLPYEYKASTVRRYSQSSRNENTRGRSGYKDRNSGRFNRSSHSQNQGQSQSQSQRQLGYQQSPDIGNTRPGFSRNQPQEYVGSRSIMDSNVDKNRKTTGGSKDKDRSYVPRIVPDATESKTTDNSEAEENCVMKSLIAEI